MKHSEAKKIVSEMITVMQKARSNIREGIGTRATEEFLGSIHPYLFGDKCPLDVLLKMQEAEKITPMEFYNMCFMFHRLMNEVVILGQMLSVQIPEPDTEWVKEGWEDAEGI